MPRLGPREGVSDCKTSHRDGDAAAIVRAQGRPIGRHPLAIYVGVYRVGEGVASCSQGSSGAPYPCGPAGSHPGDAPFLRGCRLADQDVAHVVNDRFEAQAVAELDQEIPDLLLAVRRPAESGSARRSSARRPAAPGPNKASFSGVLPLAAGSVTHRHELDRHRGRGLVEERLQLRIHVRYGPRNAAAAAVPLTFDDEQLDEQLSDRRRHRSTSTTNARRASSFRAPRSTKKFHAAERITP